MVKIMTTIPTKRERTIDTFTAKELAKGSRTTLNNTKTYRALNGSFSVESKSDQSNMLEEDPVAILYKRYQELSE